MCCLKCCSYNVKIEWLETHKKRECLIGLFVGIVKLRLFFRSWIYDKIADHMLKSGLIRFLLFVRSMVLRRFSLFISGARETVKCCSSGHSWQM